MSRTHNSVRNMTVAVIGQILVLIAHFVSRTVFINTLGIEYLGVNGVFTNMLSMLSLAELGVGTAITYTLYKPLAEGDDDKVNTIMDIFKKVYIIIGLAIGVIGLGLIPFLDYIVGRTSQIDDLNLLYVLFLANTVSSYFFSYNQSLLIADQKSYIVKLYTNGINLLLTGVQIAILIYTNSFTIYLTAAIVATWITNLIIRHKVRQRYEYLKNRAKPTPLSNEETTKLKKNVGAMTAHKIGGVVVYGTDNIIIAAFVSVATVGYYANYLLVTATLTTLIGLIYQSASASIGNLKVLGTEEKNHSIFSNIYFFSMTIAGFTSICLLVLVNPFIEVWIGKEFLLDKAVVFIIVINFYLRIARHSVSTTKDAMGRFWNDRYKPIFEAVLNLGISIVLVINLGLMGVILGTIISFLLTTFWVEPYVLYKHGLKGSLGGYFISYILRTLVTVGIGAATLYISTLLPGQGIGNFMMKFTVCITFVPLAYTAIYCRSKEFKYFVNIIKKITKKRK